MTLAAIFGGLGGWDNFTSRDHFKGLMNLAFNSAVAISTLFLCSEGGNFNKDFSQMSDSECTLTVFTRSAFVTLPVAILNWVSKMSDAGARTRNFNFNFYLIQ